MADKNEMAHAEKVLSADAKPAAPKHGGAKSSGKKKKGAKASDKVPLGTRISGAMGAARAGLVELVADLRSPDGPTRRMSMFFFLSLAGLIALGVVTSRHWLNQRARKN